MHMGCQVHGCALMLELLFGQVELVERVSCMCLLKLH